MKYLDRILVFIALFIAFTFLATMLWISPPFRRPEPGFLLTPAAQVVNPLRTQALELVQIINQRNAAIISFVCDDIDIHIQQKFSVRVSANVRYRKNKFFRLISSSFFGKEMDIGSNLDHFWFWSRRMNPPALHYAKHENLNKTRLKTPFHPVWMKEILSIDPISIKGAWTRKRGNNLEIIRMQQSATGRPVVKITMIDPKKLAIVGHYVYENGKLVASAEVYEHTVKEGYYLPSKILIRWYQENVTMVWQLHNIQINVKLDPSSWDMPRIRQKIEMGI